MVTLSDTKKNRLLVSKISAFIQTNKATFPLYNTIGNPVVNYTIYILHSTNDSKIKALLHLGIICS